MPSIKKRDCVYFLAILLFILLFFKPVITGGDAYGYYAILEGIGKYHTLNLSNEVRYNGPQNITYVALNNITHNYVSIYPPGLALVSLPLYELSLALDDFRIFHVADEYFVKTRGDILIHQMSVTITTLIFLIIAFYCTIKSMEILNIRKSAIAMLLVFFGTPIILYATQYSSNTHVVEAGLFSAIVYCALSGKDKNKEHLAGAIAGILTIIRYPDILVSVFNYAYMRNKKQLLKFAIGIIPFLILLVLYFKSQYGAYLTTGYSGYPLQSYPAFLLKMLFDPDRGIIFWTPLFFLSLYGLLLFKNEMRTRFMLPFIFLILFYSSWWSWDSGWSFGNRFFIVLFPLQCIGIGKVLDEKQGLKWIAYLCAAYTFMVSLFFLSSTAYISDPYMLTEQLKFWSGQGNISMLLSGIYEKMFSLRFLLGAGGI